jgi:hypothetical protein
MKTIGVVLPDGFVLVPKEPTPEMLAVDFEQCTVSHIGGAMSCEQNRRSLYRAMIAAAEKPNDDDTEGVLAVR